MKISNSPSRVAKESYFILPGIKKLVLFGSNDTWDQKGVDVRLTLIFDTKAHCFARIKKPLSPFIRGFLICAKQCALVFFGFILLITDLTHTLLYKLPLCHKMLYAHAVHPAVSFYT